MGAYPLTVAQTPYLLTVDGNRIQAICAVDAVSVAPMFDKEVTVHSRCSVTGTEIRIEQRGRTVVNASPSSDIQIGFWWREPGSIAARNLCPGIVFLRDRTAAIAWQAGDTRNHDFTSLVDAIDVGARFFGPLIRDTPTPSSTKP